MKIGKLEKPLREPYDSKNNPLRSFSFTPVALEKVEGNAKEKENAKMRIMLSVGQVLRFRV